MYEQEAVAFLMQKWESLALFCAHTKSNLLPKIERKIKEKQNEKKWQKRNSKLNTYSALVTHSYFNFDKEIC